MRKMLILGLVLLYTATLFNISGGLSAPATPKVYVEPNRNVFSTQTASIGDTFTINISTSGWEAPGLFGYELQLKFDKTLLEVTAATYPANHFVKVPDKPIFEATVDLAEANANGAIPFAASPLADPAAIGGRTGGGVLATAKFKIIKAPPPALSCKLEITETSFLDPDGNKVPVDTEDGYYEFTMPKVPVYLKVEPKTVSAAKVDDEVTISVTIKNMQSALQLSNVTFKLQYNTTLLSTSKDLITPGTTYPYFSATVEEDYVKIEIQMATQAPFPDGNATLATIKFKAIYVPPTLTTSPLTLSHVRLTDISGNIIEYDHLEHSEYQVPVTARREDLNGDGKINIDDIYEFAKAFGSKPGHPRWDPKADINGDNKVNTIDAVLIAKKFGT